jgi:DNA primase
MAPCTWEEIEKGKVEPDSSRCGTCLRRIKKVGDLWADGRAAAVTQTAHEKLLKGELSRALAQP